MKRIQNNFLFHLTGIVIFVGLMFSGCAEGPDRNIEHKIFLTHADLNMIEGDEIQVTASPTNQTFKWESSNTAVVTVSSTGLVRAIGDGSCFIYVTSSGGLERTIPVDVVEYLPLAGIDVVNAANLVTVESLSILLGQTLNLKPIAVPENYNERIPFNVVWESKDENIIVIDEATGVLQAIDFGSTEITVSSVEKPEIKRVIKVDVPETRITDIVVSQSSIDLIVEESATLTTSFLPENYSVKDESLVLTSSDPSIVSVTNGTFTAVSAGQATIRVALNEDPGVYTDVPVYVESPSFIDLSKFKGTGLNDNLVYKRVYFEKDKPIDVPALSSEDISAVYNRDFMEWNPATQTLTFTGETGQWDVYYSNKYRYFWIRQDERNGSTTGVYWLRGQGFTQAPVWNPDLAGSSGGYCWGLAKIRFAAYMKPLGNNRFQASIYITSAAQSSSFWIAIKHNLCSWSDPPGTPLTLVAPPGFTATNTDVNVRPAGFEGGYYRFTMDLNTKQRILEKIN